MFLTTLCTEPDGTTSPTGMEQVEDGHLIMLSDMMVMRWKQGMHNRRRPAICLESRQRRAGSPARDACLPECMTLTCLCLISSQGVAWCRPFMHVAQAQSPSDQCSAADFKSALTRVRKAAQQAGASRRRPPRQGECVHHCIGLTGVPIPSLGS